MTTALQQAAQQALETLESGALLCELTAASILRVALEAEQAQAVEPTITTKTEQVAGAISKHISTPLIQREVIAAAQYIAHRYMRPTPPTPSVTETLAAHGVKLRTQFEEKPRNHVENNLDMVGERASLMRRADASVTALNSRIMEPFYCSLDQDAARVLSDCVDMLESDVSLINEGNKAQQVAVPATGEQLCAMADRCTPNTETGSLNYLRYARAIEAHHGIGAKP